MKLAQLARNRFLRDSAILQIGGALNSVGNLLSSVVLAHLLGARDQGNFYTAQAIYALAYLLLNLGMTQAAVSQVASANARGLQEKLVNWLAFLSKIHVVTGVLLLGLGCLALAHASGWLPGGGLASAERRYLTLLALCLCATPILEMPRVVCCAAFQGTRRMLPLAQTENGTEACRVVLVIAGASLTGDPLGPIVGSLIASALGSVLAIDLYRNARRDGGLPLPAVREIARRMRAVPLREGLPLGVRIGMLRGLDATMTDVLPPLLIQAVAPRMGAETVAYFRIAQRVMRMPQLLLSGFARNMLPLLSELAGKRDLLAMRKVYLRATLIAAAVTSSGVLLCLAAVPVLLHWLYPDSYAAPVWNVSWVLALGAILQSFHVGFDAFYIVVNRLRVAIFFGLSGAVLYLSLAIALAHVDPLTAPAWALLAGLSYSTLNLVYILRYFRQHAHTQPAPAG